MVQAVITENAPGKAPATDIDPFAPEVLRDTYAYHDLLRALGPVVYISRYNIHAVTGYAQVREVLEKWDPYTSARGAGLSDITQPGAWRAGGPIVEVDPPRHTKTRGALGKILSPIVVRNWGEKFKAEGAELVESVVARGRFDGVRDLAEAFVLKVFPDVLGLEINRDQAVAVGNMNFNALGPMNAYFEASVAEVAPFLPWWQKITQRESMIPGGFGELIFQAEDAGELDPGTASGLIMSMLRGGMDTTISAIGSALWLLSRNQEQWELLRREPNRARGVFDETIRLESPIQTFFRTAKSPTVLAGVELPEGMKVAVHPGAANRDPSRWENPTKFDITRQTAGQLALGYGIHNCIGQMIARLEFESVVGPFAKLVKAVELDASEAPPSYRPNNALRTLAALPLKVTLA